MACVSGTNIVNNGLVFHFDLENGVKSWRGKPTNNLAVNKFFNGNLNFTVDENITDTMPDDSIGIARLLNAQIVVDTNRTVSIGNYSLTAGYTYTLSFYVMNINCTGFGGNLYSPGLGRVIGSISYPTIYTDRWTRVTKTFTVPDEGINPVTVSPQVFRDGGVGKFKMCWLQMEEGSIATKYINGVRLDTESIIDLSTNQNTITTANLTYRQDDTPTFDGTNDYIVTNRIPGTGSSTSSVSWCIWTKPQDTDGNIMSMSSSNPQASWNMPPIAADNKKFRGKIWSNSYLYSDTYVQGIWYYVCLIFNYNSTLAKRYQRLYINGAQVAEQTGISYSSSGNDNFLFFGQANPGADNKGYYSGEIGFVQVYDRALSASEVKQNFEALRGRYGI